MKKPTDNHKIDHIPDAGKMVGYIHQPLYVTPNPRYPGGHSRIGTEPSTPHENFGQVGYVSAKYANLFAAAPDLLAACKRFTENIDRWLEDGDPAGADESESIHNQAVAAIRKAEQDVIEPQ